MDGTAVGIGSPDDISREKMLVDKKFWARRDTIEYSINRNVVRISDLKIFHIC
jgi:hypothetical protein